MTIPESVREAAERIREMRRQSDEFDGGYPATDEGRTQSLFDHCAVAEWAVENVNKNAGRKNVNNWWMVIGDGGTLGMRVEYHGSES